MRPLLKIALTLALSTQIVACVPAVVGGAAATGVMASDRRTSGTYIEDKGIELKSENKITAQLGAANIHANVSSFNRYALITGEAVDEATRSKAEAIVKSVENVKGVTNELQIGVKSAVSNRANDSYLTSKIKTLMIKENRFPANYVKVVTEDSVVYLMGLVTKKEAEDAVDIARHAEGVDKVVKVFEYLD